MRATRTPLLLAVAMVLWGWAAAEPAGADSCVRGGRRCSTPPASSRAAKARSEQMVAATRRLAPGERVVVPVVYHVIYGSYLPRPGEEPDDLTHAPPLALTRRQTQALERAFRGTGFSFVNAGASFADFARWGREPRLPGERPPVEELTAMIHELTVASEESLHVFLMRRTENRAAPPDTRSMFESEPGADGIVMDWDYLPYVEALHPIRDRTFRRFYFQGEMLVHLVGHYCGLLHTFEEAPDDCWGRCSLTTDFVRDTPAHRWTWDEKIGRCIPLDTCPDQPGMDPMTNYMNLEPDLCASEFTPGQVERMERMLRLYRPYLIVPATAGSR